MRHKPLLYLARVSTPAAPSFARRRLEAEPDACQPVVMLLYEFVADNVTSLMMPINALRNAALLPASTPLVAMVDADLLVSRSLAQEADQPDK